MRLDPATLGVQGGKGDRGARGSQGLKGEKGDAGSPGASASDIPGWVQAAILFLTMIIVWIYTRETKRLREAAQGQVKESQNQAKEAQRQTELQLRPFVIFEATRDELRVKNIGNGTALNVRVRDIQLSEPTVSPIETASFSTAVPILLKNQYRPIQCDKLMLDGELAQKGGEAHRWVFDILKPIIEIAKPDEFFRPEIVIEFENVEKQSYFVKERLAHGELEIIDSGRL
jgi:hypothetical protein